MGGLFNQGFKIVLGWGIPLLVLYIHYIIKVVSIASMVAMAGGGQHSASLKNDGALWTWGDNQSGKLWDGASDTGNLRTVPV